MRRLTSKQEAFAALVAAGKHPTEAYATAYDAEKMKPRTVEVESGKLLRNPAIATRVQDLRSKALESTREVIEVNLERALFENASIAFSDVRLLVDKDGRLKRMEDLDDATARAISGVKVRRVPTGKDADGNMEYDEIVEYKFWDKGAALDRFLKHFGGYEKDNRQKGAGFLDSLPREVAKAIVDRLKALSGPVVG